MRAKWRLFRAEAGRDLGPPPVVYVLLFLAGLLTGFAIPFFRSSRIGLSAHLTGVQSCTFLIAFGLMWPRLSLAQVYASEGKMADAEKVLRDAIANPSLTVSKEHATIVLGELLAQNNPAEAHKLIDPLRTSLRGAISRTAITDSANLPPVNAPAPAK